MASEMSSQGPTASEAGSVPPTPASSDSRAADVPGEANVGPVGAILGRSPFAPRVGLLNNAEIVVWQASRRLTIALTIGVVAVVLRLTRVINGPVWPFFAILPAYLGIVALLTVAIERK